MIVKSPTVMVWDLILRYELLILIFIRAHREKNFPLYLESLEALVCLFFSLDHFNYSRWASVHLRDMKSLTGTAKEDLSKNWVIQKSSHRYSAIPIDQTHEQEIAKVKGNGGVVGLTENPVVLKRWIIAGPEKARLITEFERTYFPDVEPDSTYKHHEEGISTQESFKMQTKKFVQTITGYGNPFLVTGSALLVLNTRDCVDDSIALSYRNLEELGSKQFFIAKVHPPPPPPRQVCVFPNL